MWFVAGFVSGAVAALACVTFYVLWDIFSELKPR